MWVEARNNVAASSVDNGRILLNVTLSEKPKIKWNVLLTKLEALQICYLRHEMGIPLWSHNLASNFNVSSRSYRIIRSVYNPTFKSHKITNVNRTTKFNLIHLVNEVMVQETAKNSPLRDEAIFHQKYNMLQQRDHRRDALDNLGYVRGKIYLKILRIQFLRH